ncbi:hypothetical protein RB594_007816 [Gaeumannomyces avenae]
MTLRSSIGTALASPSAIQQTAQVVNMSSKPKVLLTGGSGFIAAHILEQLLEKGYRVVTTVRSQDKADKIRAAYPKAELEIAIVPDIAQPDAFDDVVRTPGIELVLHTASPVHYNIQSAKELIDPAVVGTTSILKAVARSAPAVRRVVVTSSFAAIVDPARAWDPAATFDESSWNPVTLADADADKATSYRASKKLAERAAWEFVRDPANAVKFDMATVNPPMVFGPVVPHFVSRDSVNLSNARVVDLLQGKWRADGPPETGIAFIWIDVRDLAACHLRALEAPEAGGKRLLTTAGTFSNREICDVVRKHFGDEYADKLPSPDVKGGEIAPEDKRYKFDNSETNRILGAQYRTLEQCMVDTVKVFKTVGL